ncbi:MAG TPA: hypothetical protein VLS25_04615, partial [Dehalococcoidia bacterium]|nr:hypothetical protein [Dehalococcoidia bacterium]
MGAVLHRLGWVLAAIVSLAALAAVAGLVAAGPLDPTGPPGSTGKNVITSLPFTISQPGSYVLNGNLTGVSGQNGITVNAADVTIDLQGFELAGVSGSGDAVQANSANVAVRNGTIRDWSGAGFYAISDATADGLRLSSNTRGLDLGPRSSV